MIRRDMVGKFNLLRAEDTVLNCHPGLSFI